MDKCPVAPNQYKMERPMTIEKPKPVYNRSSYEGFYNFVGIAQEV